MAPSAATVREFIRRVYRDGGANATTRGTYLDGLADTALTSQQRGKLLTMSSDKGTSAQYAAFAGWSPQDVLALIDEVREFITESTAALAIAAYNGTPMKGVSTIRSICRYPVGLAGTLYP